MSLLDKVRGKLVQHQENALVRRAEHDLEDLSPTELRKVARILETRQQQADLQLTELQTRTPCSACARTTAKRWSNNISRKWKR